MFTYAHAQVPAYVPSSAGRLVSGAELNKETESPDFFSQFQPCYACVLSGGLGSALYAPFDIPDYC